MIALAVCHISSIASSIAEVSAVIALRSNGVMKERRTATSTSRVTSSAAFSCVGDLPAGFGDRLLAREHLLHRVGAGDEDLRVALEHVEEAVLPRHDRRG